MMDSGVTHHITLHRSDSLTILQSKALYALEISLQLIRQELVLLSSDLPKIIRSRLAMCFMFHLCARASYLQEPSQIRTHRSYLIIRDSLSPSIISASQRDIEKKSSIGLTPLLNPSTRTL